MRSRPLLWRAGRPVPCPTLDWLVDPTLKAAVADLERRGGVRAAERWLDADPRRRGALADAHRRYAARRAALLTAEDWAALREHHLTRCFDGLGVAGIDTRSTGVKCLHAHVAHHLVEGNPVGAWALDRLAAEPSSRNATAPAGSTRSVSTRL